MALTHCVRSMESAYSLLVSECSRMRYLLLGGLWLIFSIEHGKNDGTATLVHCRVGVSRSASICIAEVMVAKGLSFPNAYCFVRARRLNVIIQPHLRFV
jgi:hypothetical protein